MKILFFAALMTCLCLDVSLMQAIDKAPAVLKVSGSHISSTGAPGENTCAQSSCHATTSMLPFLGDGTTFLEIDKTDNGYAPSQTYTLTLRAERAHGIKRAGFQITALDSNFMPAGSFSLVEPNNRTVQLQSGSILGADRKYATHTAQSTLPDVNGKMQWKFQWTAPFTYRGKVTFYFAVNISNNDLGNSGDSIFVNEHPIFGAEPEHVSEGNLTGTAISCVPSPANGDVVALHISSKTSMQTQLEIYSAIGRKILSEPLWLQEGMTIKTISTVGLAAGNYRIAVIAPEQKKLVSEPLIIIP